MVQSGNKKQRATELVEESLKTKKARKKLQKKLETIEKKVTSQAIAETSQEISGWIARHASDRVIVSKDISLFDKNRNSAKMSRNVAKLAEELASTSDGKDSQ